LISVKTPPTPWPQVYLCVALTTLATLLLELSLTRIFSVVFYFHFAFLAISIALFGLGAGGVFSYVVAGWKAPLFTKLGRLSVANTLLVLLALFVILIQGNNLGNLQLGLIYFTTALPFFTAGAIVSLAISETIERVNRVYFYDLAGAAAGCLLLTPLLEWLGGPSTVVCSGIFFAVAAAIWFSMAGSLRGRVGSVTLALILVAFITYNYRHPVIEPTHAKNQTLKNEFFIKWNSFSRIAVVHELDDQQRVVRNNIVIDADAATSIFDYPLDQMTADQQRDVRAAGESLPYAVRPGAKTLVIGPGGGWDVARALASGSKDVTAIEINPIIAHTVMQERLPELSRHLYDRPEVHVHVEDGRSFVRRSTDHYQVIQATLVDTWASTAAGAFALSENNLYTTDAFRDYLSHLTDDGVVVFTRWGFQPPRESLRLISLGMEALSQLGENDPASHVIVGRADAYRIEGWGAKDTVLISRKPLSPTDVDRARALFASAKMEPIYLPGANIPSQFQELLTSADPTQYQRNYTFDISPVTDNRPFFFYTVQPRDLWTFLASSHKDSADYKINKAVPLLFGLMGVSLLATAVILVAPPLVLGTRLPSHGGIRGFLVYFLFIGAGYILIEVALIQKFVLFLGHPVHALWVVIFSMLVSSGVGSNFSRRIIGKSEGRLIKALGCVAFGAALLALGVSTLLGPLVWLPFPLKVLLTVAMIAPLGFVMGMPFPVALQRLEAWHAPSVRWAWSLNAASSVLGSVGALVCAIYMGLVQTMIMGGLFYLAALAVIARTGSRETPAPEPGPGRVVLAK
jgi:predicted membrane-bound spermidine synthase